MGGAANPGVTVTLVQPTAAAATEASALIVRAGGEGAANAPSDARTKRSPKAHPLSDGGAASSTASAIMSAGGSPPRKKGLPPGKGAPPRPEDAGGLSDGDDDTRRDDESVDGGTETVTAHGTAPMMQCMYTEFYGNPAPSKAQMVATGESERSPALVEADAKRVKTELLGACSAPTTTTIITFSCSESKRALCHPTASGFLITAGAISTLSVDSEIHKAKMGWHHAVEGSLEEVVRYLRSVEAEFQIPGERTSAGKSQDWAVNLAWGGTVALADSGMMKIFRKEGDRQVDTGKYDGEKLERLRRDDEALQRQNAPPCRRAQPSEHPRASAGDGAILGSGGCLSTTGRSTQM